MIDITLHFVCSYLLTLVIVSSTRNALFSIAIALMIGFGKEIFLDSSISLMDISANLAGIVMVLPALRTYKARRI